MSDRWIIVGAGSAGAVIAARATEVDTNEVVLVESGPDYTPDILPPDLIDGGRNSVRAHDWDYRHKPTAGQINFLFPRGRVVGGSSAVNTCIALRGQPYDYEEWAERAGVLWSWKACLPAFIRLERDLDFDDEWHGTEGPLPLRRHLPREWTTWQTAFVEACRELGHPECPDSNAPTATGVGPHAMNKIEGRRISAAEAYLTQAVRRRKNLEIRPETHVLRILFDGRRARGVEVRTKDGVETIEGRVVLCAGSLNTPGILLRSGVGPKSDLDRVNVDCVSNVAAVGAQKLDHPGTAIFFVPKLGVMKRSDPLIQTVVRFQAKTGTLANEMTMQPGSVVPLPWLTLPLVSIMCMVGKPRRHGKIYFESADPDAKPIVDSKLFEDAADMDKGIDAMMHASELFHTKSMRDLGRPFWPSRKAYTNRDLMAQHIRRACDSGYHPCGTVPMGEGGATDSMGRVNGTEGLIVADASLMPTVPTANINLATLMIGERFGEWIRNGEL